MSDEEFFDEKSPVTGRPRRDSIADTLDGIDDLATRLRAAVDNDNLALARQHFANIKQTVEERLDDDLCERDEDGFRVDS